MTATTKSSTELAAAFEQEAKRLLEEFKIPGVTLGLLTPDGDHLVNLGVTSLENPLPITSDTIFQIGSNTKTLTSLTVSVLEAQGKLKRDDTVRTYLPDFKLKDESVAAQLTILDTLTHQGGFQGDLFEDTGDGDDALAKVLDKLAEAPQVVPLRGHWSYNNAGFYIAGRIIEVVTGMTWEAAVTELVLKPLGMDHTLFFPNMIMTHRFVAGHNKIGDEFVVQRPWQMVRSAGPAGSSCSSTVSDMARYAHYIMSGTVAPASEPQEGEGTSAAAGEGGSTETSPLATLDRTRLWTPVRPIGIALNGFPGRARADRPELVSRPVRRRPGHQSRRDHSGPAVGLLGLTGPQGGLHRHDQCQQRARHEPQAERVGQARGAGPHAARGRQPPAQ